MVEHDIVGIDTIQLNCIRQNPQTNIGIFILTQAEGKNDINIKCSKTIKSKVTQEHMQIYQEGCQHKTNHKNWPNRKKCSSKSPRI